MATPFSETLTADHVHKLLTALAEHHASSQRLVVDDYRIRRVMALPLPVEYHGDPDFPTRLGSRYPWSIWLTWSLEQRVHALAWSANQWTGDGRSDSEHHTQLAIADLKAITQWSAHNGLCPA